MTKYDKAVSVCFSGHRSVPFAKRRELKQCLKSEIAKAYADGYRYFYCGMAMDLTCWRQKPPFRCNAS